MSGPGFPPGEDSTVQAASTAPVRQIPHSTKDKHTSPIQRSLLIEIMVAVIRDARGQGKAGFEGFGQ